MNHGDDFFISVFFRERLCSLYRQARTVCVKNLFEKNTAEIFARVV